MWLTGLKDCQKCSLCETRKNVVPGRGAENASLMIVGLGPGETEDAAGRAFVGESGKILIRALRRAGWGPGDIKEQVYITNTVKCWPPDNKPKRKHVKACAPYLDEEIEIVSPRVIVPLGNEALERVLGLRGISKYRGKPTWSEDYETTVVPSFHPAYIARNPSEFDKLVDDFLIAREHLEEEGYQEETEKSVQYKIVKTIEEARELAMYLGKCGGFALDIETQGLDLEEDEILSIHFSWKERTAVGLPLFSKGGLEPYWEENEFEEILELFREALSSKAPKFLQNAKFDTQFLMRDGMPVSNVALDTLLMQYLLHPEAKGQYDLKFMAFRYTDLGEYDSTVSDWLKKHKTMEGIPNEDLFPYGNADADATYRIAKLLWKRMGEIDSTDAKEGLGTNLRWVLRDILVPLSRVLTLAEYRGIKVDLEYLEGDGTEENPGKIREYKKIMDDAEKRMHTTKAVQVYEKDRREAIVRERRAKWRGSSHIQARTPDIEEYANYIRDDSSWTFNPNSSVQLQELLYEKLKLPVISRTKKKNPSADKDTLETLRDEHAKKDSDAYDLLDAMLDYAEVQKMYSTYLRPIPEMVDKNGRLHTSYLIFGTETGRLSSREPNLQNIPKTANERAYDIRRYFVATPGYVLVEADFKQAEFRWWAEYSQDKKLIKDIKGGMDIHDSMARDVFEIPDDEEVDKRQRMMAKTVVFGSIYGRSVQSIANQFGITEAEAQRIQDRFMQRYPDAGKWIRSQKKFAHKYGKIVTFFGRHRPLAGIHSRDGGARGHAERQAVNTPIQSAAADTTFLGFIKAQEMIEREGFDAYILLNIHDAVVLEVREDQLDEFLPHLTKAMESPVRGPGGKQASVPMKIEIAVGPNLADMEELELAAEHSVLR